MITVKKATKKDLDTVVELAIKHLEAEGKKEPRNILRKKQAQIGSIREKFDDPNRAWFLADMDGKVVGIARADVIDGSVGAKRGKISFAYVEPKFRRQGVGKALTKARLEWLKKKKMGLVEVAIRPDNVASHANLKRYKLKPWLMIYTFKLK